MDNDDIKLFLRIPKKKTSILVNDPGPVIIQFRMHQGRCIVLGGTHQQRIQLRIKKALQGVFLRLGQSPAHPSSDKKKIFWIGMGQKG